MKTKYFTKRYLSAFTLVGLLAFMATSCGSYKNSSYYDSDGIYVDGQARRSEPAAQEPNNRYKDYFSSLNEDAEIFTDVDSYNSYTDTDASTESYSGGDAGWGSEPDNITVNVYGNNWGYGLWNNYWYSNYWAYPWYGPSWGLGWNSWYGPSWGWGWHGYYPYYNYGWGSPYVNNNYYYNNSYRGSRRGESYNSARNYSTSRSSLNTANSGRRTYTTQGTTGRRNDTFINSRNSNTTRSNSSTRSQNTYTPSTNSGTRTVRQPSTSTRSSNYTPSSSPTRSSGTSSGSRGGSSSGGSRGGGRR